MKTDWTHLEKFRVSFPGFESKAGDRFGVFMLSSSPKLGLRVKVIATDGVGTAWEHVSVTAAKEIKGKPNEFTPTWSMMCMVKDLFWDPEEAVMQLHPPASQYVNQHEHCLHLWKPTGERIPMPPKIFV